MATLNMETKVLFWKSYPFMLIPLIVMQSVLLVVETSAEYAEYSEYTLLSMAPDGRMVPSGYLGTSAVWKLMHNLRTA